MTFPPPRSRAILPGVAEGIAMDDFVYPVAVTGTMTVAPAHTGIAGTGYTIAAGSIVPAE